MPSMRPLNTSARLRRSRPVVSAASLAAMLPPPLGRVRIHLRRSRHAWVYSQPYTPMGIVQLSGGEEAAMTGVSAPRQLTAAELATSALIDRIRAGIIG